MNANNLTEHAQQRKQQRGVTDVQIALINMFGENHYQKGGCSLSYIPEKKLAEIRRAVDKLCNIALVKDASERGITTMHMDRRIYKTGYVA